MSEITFKVELANRVSRGRAVGNDYLVVRYVDGCRANIIARWGAEEVSARMQCLKLNQREREKVKE